MQLDRRDITALSKHRRAAALPIIVLRCFLILLVFLISIALLAFALAFVMAWQSNELANFFDLSKATDGQFRQEDLLLPFGFLFLFLAVLYMTVKGNLGAAGLLFLFYAWVFGADLYQLSQGWPAEREMALLLNAQAPEHLPSASWSPVQIFPALLYALAFKAVLLIFAYRILRALIFVRRDGSESEKRYIFPPSAFSTPATSAIRTVGVRNLAAYPGLLLRVIGGGFFQALYVAFFLAAIALPFYLATGGYRQSLIASNINVAVQFFQIAFGLALSRFLFFIATKIFLYPATRMLSVPAETLRVVDRRPPVLYLRSFRNDVLPASSPADIEIVHHIYPYGESGTLEQLMARRCRDLGPIVAIAEPGVDQPLGAARRHAGDENWQDIVVALAREAAVIVVLMDVTTALQWELGMIQRDGHLMKTIFVFPPPPEAEGAEAADARALAGIVFGALGLSGAEVDDEAAARKVRAIASTPAGARVVTSSTATFADYDIAMGMLLGR